MAFFLLLFPFRVFSDSEALIVTEALRRQRAYRPATVTHNNKKRVSRMNSFPLLLLCPLICASALANTSLTVVSYGGNLTNAQIQAAHKPFTAATGTQVISEDYSGGIAQIKTQVDSKKVSWDVVDAELLNVLRACNTGLLEKIDPKSLAPAPDGTPAEKDFIPGALSDCGVASYVWSTVMAYNSNAFTGEQPKTLKDFFDIKRFPGKRSLRKAPQVNLEWALMADGVPRDQVYATLETEQGLDRAFAKLDTIKDQVVWWEAGAQPPQLLADGQVSMTSAYSGRIVIASKKEHQPFKIVWDGQVYDMEAWVLPAGNTNKTLAFDFLKFATQSSVLADQANYIPYGPTRYSSQKMLSPEVQADLPTSPANFANALQVNSEWWGDHADELNERFNAWLAR
ncbi:MULTISPECIES: ABC transporter substrate-binding protein [unclassified Pseudomonas]|uniref:ABC transporter substrate-binding protein n=1 Tax=unclassified Pseudomonas TaxID=196821 RepID=UPI0021146A37|nr:MULTISPECIES: ABC transporter substrate-binding protein [unclassified Pseudomonas]MCX4216463.1 ABC transporter substrate-binding protein [Pseudomonas sp. MCal1]